MNKREVLLSLLDEAHPPEYIPAAFFLHFGPAYHSGQAAVDKHLEYFRQTGMDFVKIQYERVFPHLPEIQSPADWAKMPLYPKDFYTEPLKVVEGLVKSAGSEALVIMTLYSPFMCAGHTASPETIVQHILEAPDQVKKGMEIITESLSIFVRGCIEAGIDGFYHSTQGGEAHRFPDIGSFYKCVKPYDLILMNEIERNCQFNILHICDYHDTYANLTPFLDYPGHVVNCSLQLTQKKITSREVARMFGRPFMGGLDRKGILVTGTPEDIRKEVLTVLSTAPERFILGADCTVPSEIPWENLRTAIDTAHQLQG